MNENKLLACKIKPYTIELVGGDSVTVTSEEFDDKVEKVIDIFGGAE